MLEGIRYDQVENLARQTLDAQETMHFLRQLEEIEPKLYEYDERLLKYREFIPVNNAANPGAEEVTYRMVRRVGKAKRGAAAYGKDLPRANAYATEHTQKVFGITSSFGYSVQELRASAMAGTPLEQQESRAASRSIHEAENDVAWNGDDDSGIPGLFSTSQNIPTLGVSKDWSATASADEIIADFTALISAVQVQTKGTRTPNAALLPITQYLRIAGLPRSTNSDRTVLEFILQNKEAYGLDTISSLPTELDSAFTGGTEDGALFYDRNPDVLEQRIPLELIIHPMQIQGFQFTFNVESRHGGTVVRYPLAMIIATGI